MRGSACIFLLVLMTAACAGTRAVDFNEHDTSIQGALEDQLREWQGVSYRRGGLSKSGVDCSGFVHLTFKSRFGLSLPRTTDDLASAGKRVSPRRLRPGDLVFFKTGFFKRHVGIYVDDGLFIHASTSRGVSQSDLNDRYWSKHFWQSRRVLL